MSAPIVNRGAALSSCPGQPTTWERGSMMHACCCVWRGVGTAPAPQATTGEAPPWFRVDDGVSDRVAASEIHDRPHTSESSGQLAQWLTTAEGSASLSKVMTTLSWAPFNNNGAPYSITPRFLAAYIHRCRHDDLVSTCFERVQPDSPSISRLHHNFQSPSKCRREPQIFVRSHRTTSQT